MSLSESGQIEDSNYENWFDALPRLRKRDARLSMRLARVQSSIQDRLNKLDFLPGTSFKLGAIELLPRASGLKRPGAIAQFSWARLGTRVGVGLDPSLTHTLVDTLLGFERDPAEYRLLVTPVEYGIVAFVMASFLEVVHEQSGPIGPWDLLLDRVGPEPFGIDGLGSISTLVLPLELGTAGGVVRIWLPDGLLALWLLEDPPGGPLLPCDSLLSHGPVLVSHWRAKAGTVTLPRGLGRLRVGSVQPIDGAPLAGTMASPTGPLILRLNAERMSWSISSQIVPGSAGGRVEVLESPVHHFIPREPQPMASRPGSTDVPESGKDRPTSTDLPVTLVVELGRLNLPLTRLADLQAGDVLELSRHAREPVELTSGGKLVARGELVQIDTELGVRVLQVFL